MTRVATIEIAAAHELADAIAGVARESGNVPVALRVVVLPPLARVRRVDLPRMTPEEARRAVGRNVARWFPDARDPQTVAAMRGSGGWIVAAAPASLVEAIYAAAQERGWLVDAIVPAHTVWASRAGDGLVHVTSSHETTVVAAERGRIVAVRRVPAGAALPPELAHARPVPQRGNDRDGSQLDLVPESVLRTRAAAGRRAAWSLLGATAALLVLAAGLTLWGEHRELAALRSQRAELRDRVGRALATRDTLVGTSERLTTIASLEQRSQRWSGVIARVAEALPADASLTAFRAEADSVSLEGQARDAAGVFAAMRGTPGFVAVRASSPVRQEGGGASGQPVVERFTLAARVGRTDNP